MNLSTDQFGDMKLEDVDEFEGLEPNNESEIAPLGRFQRQEIHQFDSDFSYQLDQHLAEQINGDREEIFSLDEEEYYEDGQGEGEL